MKVNAIAAFAFVGAAFATGNAFAEEWHVLENTGTYLVETNATDLCIATSGDYPDGSNIGFAGNNEGVFDFILLSPDFGKHHDRSVDLYVIMDGKLGRKEYPNASGHLVDGMVIITLDEASIRHMQLQTSIWIDHKGKEIFSGKLNGSMEAIDLVLDCQSMLPRVSSDPFESDDPFKTDPFEDDV